MSRPVAPCEWARNERKSVSLRTAVEETALCQSSSDSAVLLLGPRIVGDDADGSSCVALLWFMARSLKA